MYQIFVGQSFQQNTSESIFERTVFTLNDSNDQIATILKIKVHLIESLDNI